VKPAIVDGRSVEHIREEVRQEFLRGSEDARERLIEELRRLAEINLQEEEVLRRSKDEDTWDPGWVPPNASA
jgi:hypothetical protein